MRRTLLVPVVAAVLVLSGCEITDSGEGGDGGFVRIEATAKPAAPKPAETTSEPAPTAPSDPAESQSSSEQKSAEAGETSTPNLSGVEAALDTLVIDAERDAIPEYQRTEHFGRAWLDYHDTGCDERNQVLQRDLTNIVLASDGCKVLTGTLKDPYTGTIIEFERGQSTSSKVQIDHVVALKDAWASGAYAWDQDKRKQIANDLDNLLAVDGPENASKGADSAADYLPVREFECAYVAKQVEIKAKYGLSVTPDEKQVMLGVLGDC